MEIANPPKRPAIDVDLPIEQTLKKFNLPYWDELAIAAKISNSERCDFIGTTINEVYEISWRFHLKKNFN